MDISEVFFSDYIGPSVKRAVLDLMTSYSIHSDLRVLMPTESNDDINGSQHAAGGGTDFTYEDATEADVAGARTLGYYQHFSVYSSTLYTGNQYQGDGNLFSAIVVDPPAYAADITI